MSNSNGQRTFFRQLDGVEVEIGFADRRELVFLADLRHAVHQQRTLDLFGDLVLESRFDQLPGARPGRNPGTSALGFNSSKASLK